MKKETEEFYKSFGPLLILEGSPKVRAKKANEYYKVINKKPTPGS